jgi:hypothetical protein
VKTPKKLLPKDPNKLAYVLVRISKEEPTSENSKLKRSAISEYLAEVGRRVG